MPTSWFALILTIACSTGGNVLANWSHSFSGLGRLVVLGAAVCVHLFGLLCFSVALTHIPLGVAYPTLVGGSMLGVTAVAVTWLKEGLSKRHFLGVALIIVGMVLLKAGAPHSEAGSAAGGLFG